MAEDQVEELKEDDTAPAQPAKPVQAAAAQAAPAQPAPAAAPAPAPAEPASDASAAPDGTEEVDISIFS